MTKDELYPRVTRALATITNRIRESKDICKANREALVGFLTKLEADGTSKAQQLSYMSRLLPIARLLGQTPFKKANKKKMEQMFAQWRGKRDYKQSSVNKSVECIKSFWRWLFDLSSNDPCPEPVRWMKRTSETTSIRPEDLWDEQDLKKAMQAVRSLRMKTMLSVAFESGMRPGELRSLRIKDVVFNGDMVRLYCRGKLEKKMGERCVPLLRSYTLLKTYLENHPQSENPDAWLWISSKNKPLHETYFRRMLKEVAEKAGIKKPNHPLILRHSALTKLYGSLPGETARVLAGHLDSRRAKTYCHLSQEQLENSVRGMYGYEKKQEKQAKPICKKCEHILDLGASICGHCGLPQNSQGAVEKMEYNENLMKLGKALLKRVEQNPKIVDEIMKGIDSPS